jgi:hypothetical protein
MAYAPPYDLFGKIAVTGNAEGVWCLAVAGLDPDSWRRPYYIRHWTRNWTVTDLKAVVEGGG